MRSFPLPSRRDISLVSTSTSRASAGLTAISFFAKSRSSAAWPSSLARMKQSSPAGNDCFILANDEGQAADDLDLAKKLIAVNPALAREVEVLTKEISRRDGKGKLRILPARDVVGQHGKTYLMVGFDEIHGYR